MYKAEKLNINYKLLRLYEKYRSLIRFGIVGFINTGVDFLAFTAGINFWGFGKLASQTVGYSTGVVNSFILNKIWTFEKKSGESNTVNQAIRFFAINLISLGTSLIVIKFFRNDHEINIYAAKLIATVAAQAINYTGYKFWVF